jgi:plastocyanin
VARLLAGLSATVVLALVAACGGSASGDEPTGGTPFVPPSSTPRGPSAADACTNDEVANAIQIEIANPHELEPADVTINVGDTVTWTNNSNFGHTITFDGGPDCGYVLVGKPTSVTFETPGEFHYICRIHPRYMSGTITVQ